MMDTPYSESREAFKRRMETLAADNPDIVLDHLTIEDYRPKPLDGIFVVNGEPWRLIAYRSETRRVQTRQSGTFVLPAGFGVLTARRCGETRIAEFRATSITLRQPELPDW